MDDLVNLTSGEQPIDGTNHDGQRIPSINGDNSRHSSGDNSRRGGVGVTLLVIANYDILRKEVHNFRFNDGSSIPIEELIRQGINIDTLPAIYRNKTEPL